MLQLKRQLTRTVGLHPSFSGTPTFENSHISVLHRLSSPLPVPFGPALAEEANRDA